MTAAGQPAPVLEEIQEIHTVYTKGGYNMVKPIHIDPALSDAAPQLKLGILTATVQNTEYDEELWGKITNQIAIIKKTYTGANITGLSPIASLRNVYKILGKDPSRYRGSSEALLRRVLQGKGLYQVNTIVDINNLISLKTLHPVGTYDLSKLVPPFTFRVGEPGQSYKGIGKSNINLENLPVFEDEHGPFGSPTSDSERAMISLHTRQIMMVIISFSGDGLSPALTEAEALLRTHVKATGISSVIAEGKKREGVDL